MGTNSNDLAFMTQPSAVEKVPVAQGEFRWIKAARALDEQQMNPP
jgi:hypothetical protein